MLTEQEYLLVKCAEEAVEVAQRADKALIFGITEVQAHMGQNPDQIDNAERLIGEIIDLQAVVELLVEKGIIRFPGPVEHLARINAKKAKIAHYQKLSRVQGCLEPA